MLALTFSTLLVLTTASPNGFYRQEYNYRTTSSSYKNHELQHHNEDEGYYSKDGDLEGRFRPRVNAHSQHSEYVNPKLQHAYRIGTDRTNSFGQLHAQDRFRMGEPAFNRPEPFGFVAPREDYGVRSDLREVCQNLQLEMERELQRAVYEQYQRAAAYGGVNQAQMETDRRMLEEELRRNMTMRIQDALKVHYGNQGIRGAYSYSIMNGRLQPAANYHNQELEDLTRQMEENLIRHLGQQFRTQYRIDTQTHSTRNTYRVNEMGDYPGALEQRPMQPYPQTVVQPMPQQPMPIQPMSQQPMPIQPMPQQPMPQQPMPIQPHPVAPIPDSITTVATRVQTELNEILNKILEDTQRRYFAENSFRSGVDYDRVLLQLQDELRTNITFHFDDQIKRAYGYSNYASKYSVEDIENLRRQIEANLITKLNRDFNNQRERYFQAHQIYMQPPMHVQPMPNQGFYPRGVTFNRDMVEMQRQLQEQMSRQVQMALMQHSYRQAHIYSGAASAINPQAHYQAALEQLSAELNRNLTRQMEMVAANQFHGNAYEAQMEEMRHQLQNDLMRQLQQGLQQSYSRFSSWSSSSGTNYRTVRGFDPNVYRVYGSGGEDCMGQESMGHSIQKRDLTGQQTLDDDDLTQQTEVIDPLAQNTEDSDLTQQVENLNQQPQDLSSPRTETFGPYPQSQHFQPSTYQSQRPEPTRNTIDRVYQRPQGNYQTVVPSTYQDLGQQQVQEPLVQRQQVRNIYRSPYETQPQYTSTYDWTPQRPRPSSVNDRVRYYESFSRPSTTWQRNPTYVPYSQQRPNYYNQHYQSPYLSQRPVQDFTGQSQTEFPPLTLDRKPTQTPLAQQQAQVFTDQQSEILPSAQYQAVPDQTEQIEDSSQQNQDLVQPNDFTPQTQDMTQIDNFNQQVPGVQKLSRNPVAIDPAPQRYTQFYQQEPQTEQIFGQGRTNQDLSQQTQDFRVPIQQSPYVAKPTSDSIDLTQQTENLNQQSEILPQQTQDLTQQTQDLSQQSNDNFYQTPNQYVLYPRPKATSGDLTQQTQDLNQQSEILPLQTQDLTQQTQDLTQQTEDDFYQTPNQYGTYSRPKPKNQDLTQQIEDLNQQSEILPQQTQDLTQQIQDLTQQTEDDFYQTPNQYGTYSRPKPKNQDLTQQSEILPQQTQDLTQQQMQDLTQQTEDDFYQTPNQYGFQPKPKSEDLTQDLNQQSEILSQQSQDLTQQTQDLTQQTQDLTQQSEDDFYQQLSPSQSTTNTKPKSENLTQQTQDLTQQTEELNEPLTPNQHIRNPKPKSEDLTQQTQDRDEQTQDLTQQTEDLDQQFSASQSTANSKPKSEDLTQQTQDLTQQTEDDFYQELSTNENARKPKPKSEDLTQQNENLTQQNEDLIQQTQDLATDQPIEPVISSTTPDQQNANLVQQTQDLAQQEINDNQENQFEYSQTTVPSPDQEKLKTTTTNPKLAEAERQSQKLIDLLKNKTQRQNQPQDYNIGPMDYSPQPVYGYHDNIKYQTGTTRDLQQNKYKIPENQNDEQINENPQQGRSLITEKAPKLNYGNVEVGPPDYSESLTDVEPLEPQVANEVQQIDENGLNQTTPKPGWWSRFKTSIKNKVG